MGGGGGGGGKEGVEFSCRFHHVILGALTVTNGSNVAFEL